MVILISILSFLGIMAGAFGVAGAGTERRRLQGWALPFIIASLVFAYIYGNWSLLLTVAVVDLIVFAIITKKVNDRHGGLTYDKQMHQMQNFDEKAFIEKMSKKHAEAQKKK